MPHAFYSTDFLRSNQPLPNPCSLRGYHSWLRKTPPAEDGSMPGVYRKTCARCGQWREFAPDGALLLTSEDHRGSDSLELPATRRRDSSSIL